MEKLTAHQIWKKKHDENLSNEQYKQLLIENGVVILKSKPSKELLTMLTSFVQDNREDYAKEVYNLCIVEQKLERVKVSSDEISMLARNYADYFSEINDKKKWISLKAAYRTGFLTALGISK